MAGQYAVQQSSAGRARQRVWQPPDLTLFRAAIGANTQPVTVGFGYPTPDARVLLKLSILFYQEVTGQPSINVSPFDATYGGIARYGLSLQLADKTPTGVWAPTLNLVGAGRTFSPAINSQMQSIPTTTSGTPGDNLDGFTIDIQGGQDCVLGTLGVDASLALAKGIVVVSHARYNLIQAEMCDDEWEAAKQLMSPFAAPQVLAF